MPFVIERYAIRRGLCFVQRRFSLSNVHTNIGSNEESVSKPDDTFTVIRREDTKSLKVAILGLPNVGKSTLVNRLINRSVCPTSSKVHTTMHRAKAIYTERNTQIIFMDTPGLVTVEELNRYKLLDSFKKDPRASITEADIVGVIQDASNIYTRNKIHKCVFELLDTRRTGTPLLLIFNKVDKLKNKTLLLELTRIVMSNKDLPTFDDVFMISALNGDGITDLRNYLLDSAKPKNWQYKEDTYIDQPSEKIVEQTVRAKFMDALPQELPYVIQIKLEHFDICEDGTISSVVQVVCPSPRVCGVLLRGKGRKIKEVAMQVEEELRHAFRTNVVVRLCVDQRKKE